jgi:hypothetical protein
MDFIIQLKQHRLAQLIETRITLPGPQFAYLDDDIARVQIELADLMIDASLRRLRQTDIFPTVQPPVNTKYKQLPLWQMMVHRHTPWMLRTPMTYVPVYKDHAHCLR